MKKGIWYFDFISPYAYLQSAIIKKLTGQIFLEPKAILFAGLLNYYGHLGPAEIPSKRNFVMQQCLWLAKKNNIVLKFPPYHPFNPLPALRLATSCGGDFEKILKIFNFIWKEGRNIEDPTEFSELSHHLGISNPQKIINNETVKLKLRDETNLAIANGVFGIPTIITDNQLFWGFDSNQFLLDYLATPNSFIKSIVSPTQNFPFGSVKRKLPQL